MGVQEGEGEFGMIWKGNLIKMYAILESLFSICFYNGQHGKLKPDTNVDATYGPVCMRTKIQIQDYALYNLNKCGYKHKLFVQISVENLSVVTNIG